MTTGTYRPRNYQGINSFQRAGLLSLSSRESKSGLIAVSAHCTQFSGNSPVVVGGVRQQGELSRKNRSCGTNKSIDNGVNDSGFRKQKCNICPLIPMFIASHFYDKNNRSYTNVVAKN